MSRPYTVMLALDLSPASLPLLHRVYWLAARRADVELRLIHVVDARMLDSLSQMGAGDRPTLQARTEALARTLLEDYAGRCIAKGVKRVEVALLCGRAETLLAEQVAAHRPDLFLAGNGNRLWRQALLGSTARRLMRVLPCTLWLGREDEASERIERVLVAADFTEGCRRVARAAVEFCGDAEFELLHVLDARLAAPQGLLDAGAQSTIEARREAEAQQSLDDLVADVFAGQRVSTRIERGHPAARLLTRSRETGAQLLALGRGSRAAAERQQLGSVAESLVESAECDLLVGTVA